MPQPYSLKLSDYALLALFALALFLWSPLYGRMLTGHESVQAQTSREMLRTGDWLIPTIGGDPWLERPPAPMWLICGVYAVAGTSANDAVARLAAVLVAVPIVLLVGMIGGRLLGRGAGLAAALIFATMHEVYSYSSNPEADIFLALVVTATLAVFVRLEFLSPLAPALRGEGSWVRGVEAEPLTRLEYSPHSPREARVEGQDAGFFTGRPFLVAVFFALLGATNLAKGMLFGTMMAAAPVAGYLAWNCSRQQLRRYWWCWGILIAAGLALAWPAAVIGRHPDILQLWKEHYFGRLNQGYLREPWWYYAAYLPYVILPWTIPALVGLRMTWKAALAGPGPERFLWCWAILPPAVFSLADGKHHHYLLQCLAPWAILAAVGARAIWQFNRERSPSWFRNPMLAAAAASLAVGGALLALGDKLPGGRPMAIALEVGIPLAVFLAWRALASADARVALGGLVAVVATGYAVWTPYQAIHFDEYRDDAAFLRTAQTAIPADHPVLVQWDWIGPLESFWVLYHSERPGVLIRDPWQAAEHSSGRDSVYILARRQDEPILAMTGKVETVLESEHTRLEKEPGHRRVLFRLTFHTPVPPPPPAYIRHVRRTLW